MKKTKEQKQWEKDNISFPQRHPNIPMVISLIGLIAAILANIACAN